MHLIAPVPPGAGAVMWWASAFDAAPSTSPTMFAPRATADSHSSSMNTAAPSPRTNPSRSGENGVLTPLELSAVMLPNEARPIGPPALSLPPVAHASIMPQAMRRAAYPMACVDAAHAVVMVSLGPRRP